jgi:hypothetical protein
LVNLFLKKMTQILEPNGQVTRGQESLPIAPINFRPLVASKSGERNLNGSRPAHLAAARS